MGGHLQVEEKRNTWGEGLKILQQNTFRHLAKWRCVGGGAEIMLFEPLILWKWFGKKIGWENKFSNKKGQLDTCKGVFKYH